MVDDSTFSESECLEIKKKLIDTKPTNVDIEWYLELFKPLVRTMVGVEGVGNFRTIAADSLSVWLQRGVQISSIRNDIVTRIDKLVSDEDANMIFNFVCDFWDDSGAALGNALKDLFIKIVLLLTKVRENSQELREILEKWTQRVLLFPKTTRVLYFTLEILARYIGGEYILKLQPHLPEEALTLMVSNALSNPIGKALYAIYYSILNPPSLFKQVKVSNSFEQWTAIWVDKTRKVLLNDAHARQHIFTYFLPQMFKLSPKSFEVFVSPLKDKETHEDSLTIFIGCLRIGQEHAIIDIYESDILDTQLLTRLLHHFSPELRIGVLSLFVISPKGSKPVPSYIFPILKDSMNSLLIEIDAGQRHEVHGLLRQFLFRIRGYSYAINRDVIKRKQRLEYLIGHSTEKELEQDAEVIETEKKSIQELVVKIDEVKEFVIWFHEYNQKQLLPGSPYHNLYTGISMLKLLIQSGLDSNVDAKHFEKLNVPFPFNLNLFDNTTIRLLIDTVGSNYEDIRLGASELLHMAPLPLPGLSHNELESLKEKVIMMISGMRGREGDSGAHISELVFYLSQESGTEYLDSLVTHLESLIVLAQNDLAKSVHEHSIHGTYTSLRYIFEKIHFTKGLDNIIQRVIQSIFDIWDIVKDILCHDSPEGNLPEELESIYNPGLEEKYGPASQIILSYSWRAIKESTSLLRCLLDRCPDFLLSNETILKIGDVVMIQLSGVKHRGAFSSVYPTYISCCRRCKRTNGLKNIPGKWLTDNLNLIQIKSQYITRRSGGLPFLITAVLTAETTSKNNTLLYSTFERLFSIATLPVESKEEKMDLPQVHAFNCIKTLFIEAELSTYSSTFVDRALDLAIASFSNDLWAIRNCAVMLFTALQNRLFGAKVDARMSAKLFFSRFKGVRSVLLSNLKLYIQHLNNNEQLNQHVETVYPVLSLLVRLEGMNGYDGLDDFIPLIVDCLKSKIWKIREMAARVLVSMINGDEILLFTKKLFEEATIMHQNELHGITLAVYNICKKYSTLVEDEDFSRLIFSKFELFLYHNPSPETTLQYFRVISLFPSSELFQKYCLEQIKDTSIQQQLSSTKRVLREDALKSYLQFHPKDVNYNDLLFDSAYEVQLATLEHLDNGYLQPNKGLQDALWRLFEEGDWDQVRGPAIRLFSKCIEEGDRNDSQITIKYWNVLYNSIISDSTEEILESSLETLGPLTAMVNNSDTTSKWISLIKKYSNEYEPFPIRLSAANSLFRYLRLNSKAQVDVYFYLYFFLTDDDFEIRDLVNEFVAEHLGFELTTGWYTEGKLLDFIMKLPNANEYLLSQFMSRDLSVQIQKVMKVDEVLFSIEKQNLFRNDYILLDEFQTRLQKLEMSNDLKDSFSKWINNGSTEFERVISTEGKDGYLGWISKNGDVFNVFYHIISGIKLAKAWNVKVNNLSQLNEKLKLYNVHELLYFSED